MKLLLNNADRPRDRTQPTSDLEKSNAGAIELGGVKRRVRFKNPTYAVIVANLSSDRNIFLQI
ncbi:MAG: hypothetical protein MUE44_33935 [Oscillatoriaceae cyanobacterium Prado104]|nr:hypothetical protein [Oscillatoriaceae cyanobacterium Prado104]